MFTRKRWQPPTGLTPEAQKVVASLQQYFLSLEDKGSLSIGEAAIIANQGIQYPATQVPSSDVNNLDDYEESASNVSTTIAPQGGSFTATATYNYTKVGRKVSIEAQGVITNVGTATGVVDIDIPFIPARTTVAVAVNVTSALGLAGYAHNNGGQGQLRFFRPDGTTAIAVATFSVSATFNV